MPPPVPPSPRPAPAGISPFLPRTPSMVLDGRESELLKEVGWGTAVEVPSPPPLTPSKHFSLFREVKQQGRASLRSISGCLFPCTSEK